VDLPPELHRRLREAAAKRGCSARQLIVSAIEQAISPPRRSKGRLVLDRPLLGGKRQPVALTNEEIYELGFP
jgi:hypothetical protein